MISTIAAIFTAFILFPPGSQNLVSPSLSAIRSLIDVSPCIIWYKLFLSVSVHHRDSTVVMASSKKYTNKCARGNYGYEEGNALILQGKKIECLQVEGKPSALSVILCDTAIYDGLGLGTYLQQRQPTGHLVIAGNYRYTELHKMPPE